MSQNCHQTVQVLFNAANVPTGVNVPDYSVKIVDFASLPSGFVVKFPMMLFLLRKIIRQPGLVVEGEANFSEKDAPQLLTRTHQFQRIDLHITTLQRRQIVNIFV